MGTEWVIETQGLSKVYRMGSAEVHALRGVDLRIRQGEFIALMGASGCGKSTLLHVLGCLDAPTAGRYLLEGRETGGLSRDDRARVRNGRIGFIFQNFNLLPRLSALENVALPLLYQGRNAGQGVQPAERAAAALNGVGLGRRAGHLPAELSGGERQRVAIARALVNDPALLLADEPTGSLDSATGLEVMGLLVKLWQAGRTLLLVTHDPNVASFAQRVLHMKDGALLDEAQVQGAVLAAGGKVS
jgi:putative ABC transport system ATP-binding protein